MPTVPQYRPQVREQGLQPVYQRTPDVSSTTNALARGLGQAAETFDAIAQRDAQSKAYDLENRVTTDWLQWDKEARANFRGEKVDGYAAAAEEWWKKAADTYGKDVDPLTLSKADRALAAKRMSAMASVINFSAAEKERHLDEVNAANIASTIQFGITTGAIDSSAQQVRELIGQQGARKGWTTEQVAAATTMELGKMHLARISQLAETDAAAAQRYYDDAKSRNEIPFTAQARAEQVLKAEGDNQFATQFAAERATLPYDQQLKAASEIADPQRREKTILALKNQHAQIKEAERAREEWASDQAWQLAAQGKRVPEALLAQMDGKERMQFGESMRARAERAAAGKAVKTDMNTYIDVRERLAAGERVNLRAYTEKIAPAQMEQLLDIQTAASKGGAKQDAMLTDEARINNALTGLGVDKKKHADQAAAFAVEVDRRVRAESMAKGGKDLTADEKQRIIDTVVLDKAFVDEWGRDPSVPVALMTPEQLENAYVTVNGREVGLRTIPPIDRSQIAAALKKRGMPVTEQAIAEIYLMKKGK